MGRNKIEIKKLEPATLRRSTYGKRYKGITKKVRELSVLCDVAVLLVTTTTSGEYNVSVGENRSFSDVVRRFVNKSKEDRADAKKKTIESLRKSFKDGHVVDVNGLLPIEGEEDSERTLEKTVQEIAELENLLGPLRNLNQLEKVTRMDELLAMERYVRHLIAQNNKIKEHILEQQNAAIKRFSTSSLRDPRYGTSATVPTMPAVPTVPLPSNHIGPLNESNTTGSMHLSGRVQLQGLEVGSDNNPTGTVPLHVFSSSIQQHDLKVNRGSNPTESMHQHGLAVGHYRNPAGSMQQDGLAVGSGSNLTGSVLPHGPTSGSSINPTDSAQQHGPTVGSGFNDPTGSVWQHGSTFGNGINQTEIVCQHGPTVDSHTRNTPERVDFQDSNSVLDPLHGNSLEGDGPNQYTQDGYDANFSVDELLNFPTSTDENYQFN